MFGITSTKETGTQLYFRNDGKATFRKLEFDGTALIEKANDKVIRAFKHYYKTEFPFDGYKNIPADMVTLGFGRDIVLDPFDILSEEERPPKLGGMKSEYIRSIGADKRYKLSTQKPPAAIWDKLTIICGVIDVILALCIALKVAIK